MAAVNTSRSAMSRNVTDAVEGAKLIGFNDDGEACVWSGGYSFNVYDAARDWSESRHFTCGHMVEWADKEKAKEMMESKGFEIVE